MTPAFRNPSTRPPIMSARNAGCFRPHHHGVLHAALTAIILSVATSAHGGPPPFPLSTGTIVVIAVSNTTAPKPSESNLNIAQGDYEMVVSITGFGADGIRHSSFIDAEDAAGVRRQASISRKVLAADLASSHLQVLGFKTEDPLVVSGTTSLGPSVAVVRELLETGHTDYSFQNFAKREVITGRLNRDDAVPVKFPILLNGVRVELPAIRATGQVSSGGATRPFEHIMLDYPQHPLSLRIAYGPRNGGIPFKADFAREIVRVDFPLPQAAPLDAALAKVCRVEVPGIYFDFNEATLKPPSKRALEEIAAVLRKQPAWTLAIEGHTDNVGGDRYNNDLSARRAASVKAALGKDHGVDASRLTTAGFGARRPIETNATIAGRARNRRVELARDCSGK
jgi:outer membrane protein OmpA-like peptidoglycan-associated protein